MLSENQDKNPFSSEHQVFEPSPQPLGFGGRLKFLFFDLWSDISDRLGSHKRLAIIITSGVALIVLILIFLPFIYTPSMPEAIPVNRQFREIIVESVSVVPRSDNSAIIVIYLRNPNKVYGINNLEFSWQGIDSDSSPLSGNGITYILPEEDKFLVIPVLNTVPRNVDFALSYGNDDFTRAVFSHGANIETINVLGSNSDQGFNVTGQIINRSPYLLRNVDLVTLLRAPTGAFRGAVATQISNLEPNAVRNFRSLWPSNLPGDTLIDVKAAVNVFNHVNLDLPGAGSTLNGGSMRQ